MNAFAVALLVALLPLPALAHGPRCVPWSSELAKVRRAARPVEKAAVEAALAASGWTQVSTVIVARDRSPPDQAVWVGEGDGAHAPAVVLEHGRLRVVVVNLKHAHATLVCGVDPEQPAGCGIPGCGGRLYAVGVPAQATVGAVIGLAVPVPTEGFAFERPAPPVPRGR